MPSVSGEQSQLRRLNFLVWTWYKKTRQVLPRLLRRNICFVSFFVASHNFWPRVAIIDNFSFHFSRRKPLKLFNKNVKSGLFCRAQEKQFFCFRRRRRSTLGPIFSKAVARLIEFTCNPNFKLSSEINKYSTKRWISFFEIIHRSRTTWTLTFFLSKGVQVVFKMG